MISFHAPAYAALLHLASTQDSRYYLNGVYAEKHPKVGVLLTATNGHIMGSIYDPNGVWEDERSGVIIGTNATLAKFAAWPRSKATGPTMTVEEERATVSDEFGSVTVTRALIDGTFPNWRKVAKGAISKKPGVEVITYDLNLMAKIGKFATAYRADRSPTIFYDQPTGPATLRFDVPELFGVIMPMRSGAPNERFPAWL